MWMLLYFVFCHIKNIHFHLFPATSLHTFDKMDQLQGESQKYSSALSFVQWQNNKTQRAAPFTFTSHTISMLVKAIGTSKQTLYDNTVYATHPR